MKRKVMAMLMVACMLAGMMTVGAGASGEDASAADEETAAGTEEEASAEDEEAAADAEEELPAENEESAEDAEEDSDSAEDAEEEDAESEEDAQEEAGSGTEEDGDSEADEEESGEEAGYLTGYVDCLRDETCPLSDFEDLKTTAWYHDGVHFCLENGILIGTGTTTFSPYSNLTQASTLVILYRLAGSPEVEGGSSFSGVMEGSWYEDAVIWAEQAGILASDEEFSVDAEVSRGQMVTYFYRFAGYLGCDVSETADLSGFADYDPESDTAEAMSWAVAAGLIEGAESDGGLYLNSSETCTRVETATIIYRFAVYLDPELAAETGAEMDTLYTVDLFTENEYSVEYVFDYVYSGYTAVYNEESAEEDYLFYLICGDEMYSISSVTVNEWSDYISAAQLDDGSWQIEVSPEVFAASGYEPVELSLSCSLVNGESGDSLEYSCSYTLEFASVVEVQSAAAGTQAVLGGSVLELSEEDLDVLTQAAESVSAEEVLAAAAAEQAEALTQAEIVALAEAGQAELGDAETLYLCVQAYLEAAVSDAESDEENGITSITLNIVPMYQIIAVAAEDGEDITEDNSAVVQEASELDIADSAELTLVLPESFASQTVYIGYEEAEGSVEYEEAAADSGGAVTFTAGGFVSYTFSLTSLTDSAEEEEDSEAEEDEDADASEEEDAGAAGEEDSEAEEEEDADASEEEDAGAAGEEDSEAEEEEDADASEEEDAGAAEGEDAAESEEDSTETEYLTGYSTCLKDDTCLIAQFTDADPAAWYHDGVHFCLENGIMQGTSGSTFEPDTEMTRSMIVTMLYRLAGSPEVEGDSSFSDVVEGAWYEDAVIWAETAGITEGCGNGMFGGEDPVTREQLAVFFYRYAEYAGLDVTASEDLSSFPDAEEVSSWAEAEMGWAVAAELIHGRAEADGNYLAPADSALRSEAATMLMRYVMNIEE